MKCKCCGENEANKPNTHYLTDSIIRRSLNEDGSKSRGKGFMHNLSSSNPFLEFKFQRETNVDSIINVLEREPSDDEINKAQENDFSVDYVFCSECEDLFSKIENQFITDILPQFENKTFQENKVINNPIIIRRFFLLQFWRTSICNHHFDIQNSFRNKIYDGIFKNKENILSSIPLKISYLDSVGNDIEYSSNLVGIYTFQSNYIIFFNNFIIQSFETEIDIVDIDLHGLNSNRNFKQDFNINESEFYFNIFSDKARNSFIESIHDLWVKDMIEFYTYLFKIMYLKNFPKLPSQPLINKFLEGLIFGEDCTEYNRYSANRIINYVRNYFKILKENLPSDNLI